MGNGGITKSASKRAGTRLPVNLEISVEGKTGIYSGQTIDVSGSGLLLWITDEGFGTVEDRTNMVRFGELLEREFHEMMRIRFTKTGLVLDAEVVRVTVGPGKHAPLLVACYFHKPLDRKDCRRLAVNPTAILRSEPVECESSKPEPEPPPPEPPEPAAAPEEEAKAPAPGRERRHAPRVSRIYYALVTGDADTVRAQILNLSHSGALMTITDRALAPPQEPHELVQYTRKLGVQFGNGMVLRILEGEVSVQADVIRVSERREGGETIVVIGIKFRRLLTLGECERLEVRAPSAPIVAAGVPAEVNPHSGKSRVRYLMRKAMQSGATDLHIKVGSPPRVRMGGALLNIGKQVVTPDEAHAMALELTSHDLAARFERDGDVELAYTIDDVGRFRVNVLRQRGMTGLAIRCIPDKVPTIEDLGLHPLARKLAEKPRGLVLVTGATGSGKSTTLAALVDHINKTRACHILTMEDPIEYIHTDVEAHITQREIGRDAIDFANALKRALRQDPDVIMVGEMRDLETISLALTAAETGHLVFATLHTTSAGLTPDRIVDVFPHGQQSQIRMQLAESLQGVMAQMLLPRADHKGMALAQEVLIANDAIRALIRENKTPQILNAMQTGAKEGMTTLEASLNHLVRNGVITYETAFTKAHNPKLIRPRDEQA